MYNGWFINMLSHTREVIASDADIVAMIVTILAGFAIVVRMVGFHYRLSSDEAGEGFGDNIRAWDFLKPIVLLLLINQAPMIGRAIDKVVTAATNSICADNELQTLKLTHRLNKEKKIDELQKKIDQSKAELSLIDSYDDDGWLDLPIQLHAVQSYQANNGTLPESRVREEPVEEIVDEYGNHWTTRWKIYYEDQFGEWTEAIPVEDVRNAFPDRGELTEEDYVEYALNHKGKILLAMYPYLREQVDEEQNKINRYKDDITKYRNEIADIEQMSSADDIYKKYGTPQASIFDEYIKYPYPDFPELFQHKWSWRSPFKSLGQALGDAVTYLPRIIWYVFRLIIAVIINAIYGVFIWIYENIILIRAFMANVAMSVMLFFFPLVFFAMLFPSYKGAFGDWLVTFVELALWFPIGTIVMHVANHAVLNISELQMGDTLWYMVILLAGILTMNSVSEYAKMALTAFGRHGEVSSGSGLILGAATGAIGLSKGMAKMPAQKMMLKKKIKRQQKENVKTAGKISKKYAKVESQDKSIRETRMALARKARADKTAFNATVAGGGGVRAAAPKWKAYKKDMKSIKLISEHHAKVMKPVAKQKAKLTAGQKSLKKLQKQSKHFYLKQMGKLVVGTAKTQAITQMDNIVKGDRLVTRTDAKNFVKKHLVKPITKTFKIGTRASITIRKKAKQATVFAKNASGPLKNSVKNRAKKVAELYSKVKGKVIPDREKVGTGKTSKYAKVGGNPNTHTSRYSKVKKAKKSRTRQSSHSRMRNLKKHK